MAPVKDSIKPGFLDPLLKRFVAEEDRDCQHQCFPVGADQKHNNRSQQEG